MTDIDAETIMHGLLADARIIGCIPAHLITPEMLAWAIEAQDEIARLIEKARRKAA